MLACKGIFATPSIGIRNRMVASELHTRRIFARQKAVYANYIILFLFYQHMFYGILKLLKLQYLP